MFLTFNLKGSSPLKNKAKENTVTVHSQKPRRPLKLIDKENAIYKVNNMDNKKGFTIIYFLKMSNSSVKLLVYGHIDCTWGRKTGKCGMAVIV